MKKHQLSAIRKFIVNFFDDSELRIFTSDHFPEVRKEFTIGMQMSQMAELLVGYCYRRGRIDDLMIALQKERVRPFFDQFPNFVFNKSADTLGDQNVGWSTDLREEEVDKVKKQQIELPVEDEKNTLWFLTKFKIAIASISRKPIALLVGIVVLSIIFWIAWINYPGIVNPPNATPTNIETTVIQESPTATSTPSITPTPFPTIPPQSDLIEIQRDDFSSLESEWDNYVVAKGIVKYDDREYSIEAEPRVLFVGMWGGAGKIADRKFALQVKLLGYEGTVEKAEQGIVFGWHQDWSNTAYAFTFSSSGTCFFRESQTGESWITTSSHSSSINTSNNTEHTLFIVISGNMAYGYIDGKFCDKIQLIDYESGLVGLASLGIQDRTKSFFDDFIIYRFR